MRAALVEPPSLIVASFTALTYHTFLTTVTSLADTFDMGTYRGVPTKPLGTHPLKRAMFDLERLPAERRAMWEPVERSFDEPFVGVTTNGHVVEGLRPLRDDGFDPAPVTRAAVELLAVVTPAERAQVVLPVDGDEWRRWTNAYATWEPHGLLLTDTGRAVRDAVVEVLRTSLSGGGFAETRDCMRLNETLAELYGDRENLGEWTYRFAIFGTPSTAEPWGWQLHGHHVDLSMLVVGRQVCLSPVFLGAEPRIADDGRFRGVRVFDAEGQRGLDVHHSLSTDQLDVAVLHPSMRNADLPPHLNHPTEGRHRSGAGKDNLVLPYEGLAGSRMTPAQRELLMQLVDVYVSRWPDGPARTKRDEVRHHLDHTHLAWVGGGEPGDAFYYRVHSPVILIEFDHHRGVFLDNPEPAPFHVHTIVRTPHGGDYGRDLLRLHHDDRINPLGGRGARAVAHVPSAC